MERKSGVRKADREDLRDWLLALRTSYIAGTIDGADPFAPPGLAEIDPAKGCATHHLCPAASLRATG